MKRRAAFLLCGTLTLGGCGPSLQSLVQAKHYREAIAAGQEGNDDDRKIVGRALDKDTDLLVHVHVVSNDELAPLLGEETKAATKRARIIRVKLQSNVLPVDKLELNGTFTTEEGRTAAVIADWQSLAWITNEKLPEQRVEKTYLTGENFLKGSAAVLTAGLSLLFTDFRPGSVVVDAPLSEFEAMAPPASALHREAGRSGCANVGMAEGSGQRCTWYFVLDGVSISAVALDIDTRYVSTRENANSYNVEDSTCALQRHIHLPLGTPENIEKLTRKRFGSQMVSVRSLVPSL